MDFQPEDPEEGPSNRRTTYDASGNKVFFTLPCSRCGHVAQYYEGTHWSEVSKMVTDHWENCPNSIRSILSGNTEESSTGEHDAMPVPPSATEGLATYINIDPPDGGETSYHITGDKRNVMNEQERKALLEADEWTADVMPTSVKCAACGRPISLDKRSRYYPGLWFKHRGKCFELKRLEAIRRLQQQGDLPRRDNDVNLANFQSNTSELHIVQGVSSEGSQGETTPQSQNEDTRT